MEEYVSCGYRPPIAVRQFEQQPALVVHSGETTVQFPVRQSYHDLFAYPLGAIEPCRTYRQDTFAFPAPPPCEQIPRKACEHRSEEHTSELQSLMRISYAVFCLKKKKSKIFTKIHDQTTY